VTMSLSSSEWSSTNLEEDVQRLFGMLPDMGSASHLEGLDLGAHSEWSVADDFALTFSHVGSGIGVF